MLLCCAPAACLFSRTHTALLCLAAGILMSVRLAYSSVIGECLEWQFEAR